MRCCSKTVGRILRGLRGLDAVSRLRAELGEKAFVSRVPYIRVEARCVAWEIERIHGRNNSYHIGSDNVSALCRTKFKTSFRNTAHRKRLGLDAQLYPFCSPTSIKRLTFLFGTPK